jgi:uncharacterized membrane protein
VDITHITIVQTLAASVGTLGTIVVMWGVVEAFFFFMSSKFLGKKDAIKENEHMRQRLGSHLLLGLEIFIAADIVSSIVSPTWERIGMLAAIVAVRTVLSYFLGVEFRQSQMHNQAHHG